MASASCSFERGPGLQPSPRVLVVDDSRMIRAVVMGCLRSTGYTVDEAGDGVAALALFDARPYDVVVSDVLMPGLDGFGLLKALETRPHRPEVIFLTGSSTGEVEAATRSLSIGSPDCLAKPPAGPQVVILAVERALERKRMRDDAQGASPSPLVKAAMAS